MGVGKNASTPGQVHRATGEHFSSTLPRLSPRGAVRQHGETGTLLMDIPLVCHGGRCLTNLGKQIINKSFHFFNKRILYKNSPWELSCCPPQSGRRTPTSAQMTVFKLAKLLSRSIATMNQSSFVSDGEGWLPFKESPPQSLSRDSPPFAAKSASVASSV